MQIKKFKPVDHFVRATVYGWSWVWKTVFGGTAPKPIFASSENWLLSVVSTLWYSPDYVTINSVEELQELYKFLKDWNHEYQTLVIDSMTEINEIIKEKIEKKIWRPMQIKERGELAKQVKWIIRAMRELPIHVIMICQAKMTTDDDWNVVTVKPMLNWKNADEIAYMMDIVAYMYINNKGERIITTSPNEKLVSKDRTWLLQSDVSLNFNDRVVAMQWMETWSTEIVQDIPKQEPTKKDKKAEPPKNDAPVAPPKEPLIEWTDKMTAMTAFAWYCTKANPTVDKKEYFKLFVADRFNWKEVDQLTAVEWKKLIEQIKEVSEAFDKQKEEEKKIAEDEARQQAENEAAQHEADAEREAQAKYEHEQSQQWSSMQDVIDDLPF